MGLDWIDRGEGTLLQTLAKLPRDQKGCVDVSWAYVVNQILLSVLCVSSILLFESSRSRQCHCPSLQRLHLLKVQPHLESKEHQPRSLCSSLIPLQHHLFPGKHQLGPVTREIISL